MKTFRIHGDNIVECERIANLIIDEVKPSKINTSLIAPSTIAIDLSFTYEDEHNDCRLVMLPGFNKANRHRWEANIFASLKESGSFLDETPDAIITSIDGDIEKILLAIEFCSALQAGNQAWQRSGRAFSTGRTGCPYLYVVDFVKYELNSKTRERKALRFPNAAIPYSYINFSKNTGNFVAQVYVRAEEFDKLADTSLKDFDENDFGDIELRKYIVRKMLNLDTSEVESILLQKNLNVVLFLANNYDPQANLVKEQWCELYNSDSDIVDYSTENAKFNFHKTITGKSTHGKSSAVIKAIDGVSVGFGSKNLPFGIIPSNNRHKFANKLKRLYPHFPNDIIDRISADNTHLVICVIKGFKPGGDDNRPDRGLLPLISMLSNSNVDTMTYIYGPIIYRNYELLKNNPPKLASANGFWNSVLRLNNFVAVDSLILSEPISNESILIDTSVLKDECKISPEASFNLENTVFSNVPTGFHEDDVDTGIHYLFAHVLEGYCFEGLCNPPGGDWSGISIIHNNDEYRWLSLPRVSASISGKRPDHIIELFDVFEKPLLLSIESKENSSDLELNVGTGLINYIKSLMRFVPNATRKYLPQLSQWHRANEIINSECYEIISAAAYLRNTAQSNESVFAHSKCDMLFILDPIENGWEIEIATTSHKTEILKAYLLGRSYDEHITLK